LVKVLDVEVALELDAVQMHRFQLRRLRSADLDVVRTYAPTRRRNTSVLWPGTRPWWSNTRSWAIPTPS
jgi:hypothetical protein